MYNSTISNIRHTAAACYCPKTMRPTGNKGAAESMFSLVHDYLRYEHPKHHKAIIDMLCQNRAFIVRCDAVVRYCDNIAS